VSREIIQVLRDHGINPTAQRLAVATYVLSTRDHPTADAVWTRVREAFPLVSRATVYNTLNLFVEKGLLKSLVLTEGSVIFDSNVTPHHHLIDSETGKISDLPWDTVEVSGIERVAESHGVNVEEYQVVLRGHAKSSR
jgi:Fur family iron response transcriptional regulator